MKLSKADSINDWVKEIIFSKLYDNAQISTHYWEYILVLGILEKLLDAGKAIKRIILNYLEKLAKIG